ncbi:hypothetical protein [Anaerobranca gottschalkii]|uniref:Uncharacterized protein n=1 Tax=Anaerobranca gottschalkii DSM 13577 TaxID=1120990 RepID=A0A1H9YNS5_9FIRM|nr:hypothetical protein [Anaerobranca gottschalkii]SES70722.1 hypothetical protein SAMN03080614_100434 [Anaerobranca gottschalkii DSM 13577]
MSTRFDYEGIIKTVSECCLTEDYCGGCKSDSCLIGYAKNCLTTSIKENKEFIDGGMDNLPLQDMKVYDEDTMVDSLAFLLHQCRNCNLYHDEDCIINVIRSAYEVVLLGDPQEYRGSTFMYLSDIKNINSEVADKVFAAFQRKK